MVELKRVVSADWVFSPGEPPLREGALLFEGDVLLAMGTRQEMRDAAPTAKEEIFPKFVLLPALVNSHTHLEFATLKRIPVRNGITGWISDLLEKKNDLSEKKIAHGAERALLLALVSGTCYLADTGSSLVTALTLIRQSFPGTLFREFLGLGPDAADEFERIRPRFDEAGVEGVRILPSCHAPYSTSKDLFEAVGAWAKSHDCPTKVHLAESRDEVELLASGEGSFNTFLKDRGVAVDRIPVPRERPVAYLDRLGFLRDGTIAVHLVEADEDELALLKRRGVTPCLCPSSNLHLTGRLPQVEAMLGAGLAPCLGTDSPASGESLNLFREMEILLDAGVPAEAVLLMGTRNGAEALRLGPDYGCLEPGSRPNLLALPCESDPDGDPLEAAIRAGARGWVRWVITPGRNGRFHSEIPEPDTGTA